MKARDFLDEKRRKKKRSKSRTAYGGYWFPGFGYYSDGSGDSGGDGGGGESIYEGGWDTEVTQSTVITPQVVKAALVAAEQFTRDFNRWLIANNQPEVKMSAPLGSSAYHEKDEPGKVYGDVDLQMIAPPLERQTASQHAGHWNSLIDQFLASSRPKYVHSAKNGHVIFQIGTDAYVQVDMIWAPPDLANWARWRTTPQQGLKGAIYGNLFSTLGEIMDMSIQHAGVQMKIKDGAPINFQRGRSYDEIKTFSTSPETFALDTLKGLYSIMFPESRDIKVASLLRKYPGVDTKNIQAQTLVNSIRGLADSFELNNMYGRFNLSRFSNQQEFIEAFLQHYEKKTMDAVASTKFDKAATPQAIARAEDAKSKLTQGLEQIRSMFKDK